jgi:ABC-type amino acid transport substrate-binding protein
MKLVILRGITCLLFSACLAHAQPVGTLAKVKESGVITFGFREASIPFSYLVGTEPTGFTWELCQFIVEDVRKVTMRPDLTVRKQPVNSGNRIPLIQNGAIDIECGNTTNNAERNKQVAFAVNHFYTGSKFLVKSGSPFKSVTDLKGKRVAAQAGTTNILVVRKLDREMDLNMELISTKDHNEGVLLLQSGRIDAYVSDDIVLYGLRGNSQNPSDFTVIGDPIQVEPYAIMLRKDDPAFKKLVDGVIARMISTGEYSKLYKKWFESPIPPRGTNLNVPMSAELEKSLKELSDKPLF